MKVTRSLSLVKINKLFEPETSQCSDCTDTAKQVQTTIFPHKGRHNKGENAHRNAQKNDTQ